MLKAKWPVLAAAAGIVVVGVSAHAQGWQARWDKTLAAAKAEGVIQLGASSNPSLRRFMQSEWPKAHPDIRLSMNTGATGPKFIRKVRAERKAGKYLWDAVYGGPTAGFLMARRGIIAPMIPEFVKPDIADPKTWGGWDNVFYDSKHKYVMGVLRVFKAPYYNAKLVSPAKVKEKGINLLRDPSMKGKIVWHDPLQRGSGRNFGPFLVRQFGRDGFAKWIKAGFVTFYRSSNEVTAAMARGLFAISMGPTLGSTLQSYIKGGLKFDIRFMGNTPDVGHLSPSGNNLYIFDKRPNPDATRVFVNWILEKDVQAVLSKTMAADSQRRDVAGVVPPEARPRPGVKYTDIRMETFEPEMAAASKLLRQIRGK